MFVVILTQKCKFVFFLEYCTSTGRTANIKILGQAIRNSFRTKKYFKKKQEKLGYLPVGSLMTGDGQEFSPIISPNISRGSEVQSSQNQSNNTVFPKPQDEHNLIGKLFFPNYITMYTLAS